MRFYRREEGGPWWVDFWHAGRRIRRSSGTPDRQDAQEWADQVKAELWRNDRLGERPSVTWDTAVLDWLEAHQHLNTLSDRKDQLRWASKYLAGKPIAMIDRATLEEMGKRKARTGVEPGTVNRHLAAISAVLGHAVSRGWLDIRPSVPKRQEAATRVKWATPTQARKLIAALPEHLGPMVAFALATGLRRYNVTHLEWTAVNMRRKIAWVHADEAKGGRTLSVPLNDSALAVLRAQRGKHKRIVFPYQGRAMARQGEATWEAACKAAGLKNFRWHDLRHTWASWHVQAGTPLAVLQELGGWRSYAMVLRYSHLAPSHVAAYAGNVDLAQNRSHDRPGAASEKAA
jgi:integrase